MSEKPFKTYNSQLKILRDRNITIKDGSKVKKILKNENYYNIINGYKNIFLDDVMTKERGDDYYKDNVDFFNIYALYTFDRNMRNILMKYLLIIENSIKTKIAYFFSEKYQKEEFPYLNVNNFNDDDLQRNTKVISILSSVIHDNISTSKGKNTSLLHYISNHKSLPLWVLIKKITFGQILPLFDSLDNDLKEKIKSEILSDYFSDYKLFKSSNPDYETILRESVDSFNLSHIIFFLKEFRNICAHEGRLYDFKCFKRTNKIPQITYNFYHNNTNLVFSSKLFDVILISKVFLPKKDFKQFLKSVELELNQLEIDIGGKNLFNKINTDMNFPKEWKNVAINGKFDK